jgi:SAM-dependent methyltransferase
MLSRLAMSDAAQTEYDAVVYPTGLYPQTHPDRLATNATLFGLDPAPVEKCRVLEIGCGDGTNLLTMAFSLPESRFFGIDLAAEPIRRGNQLIEKLGLTNVTLRQLDVLQTPDDLGVFDYIIAHGVYSWVPAEVREKIMAICSRHLSEQGLAYISYNAYPGNHLRDLVRRMMRFHSDKFEAPADKVRQARALVKFAAEAKAKPGLWQSILKQ